MHHKIHGDLFSYVVPPTLALPSPSGTRSGPVTPLLSDADVTPPVASSISSTSQSPGYSRLIGSHNLKQSPCLWHLLLWRACQLASLGIKRRQLKPEECTDRNVDHSTSLYPVYLFPLLARGCDLSACGLELKGIEQDSRSLILDFGVTFIEFEPLLHTSPQIFENGDWETITRVPADSRGFKIVIAFKMRSYTLAFLSNDNLCYTYWYSRADIELARAARVPGTSRT
ncbi:hypothetical protein K438DRAFT_1250706 [Mycena galopus ATCC 62051]|nr:hypothetical protein K438DRAFT_1250706 [Mycena galopus ATCC 62051]